MTIFDAVNSLGSIRYQYAYQIECITRPVDNANCCYSSAKAS